MGGPILHLDADDLCALLPAVNPAEVVAEELLSQPCGDALRPAVLCGHTLVPHGDDVVLWDPVTGTRCALPASGLRACRAAALTTLAASHLLAPGLVTASLIGSGAFVRMHLLVVARNVPDVSHIAVHPLGDDARSLVDRTVTTVLDGAGIGLSVDDRAEDATFGANLVAVLGPRSPRLGHLSPGAVLVNASGHDLPPGTADDVDGLFVDDLALHKERAPLRPEPEVLFTARPPDRVEADLRGVFTGRHPGRTRTGDVLRVDLLSAAEPDAALAVRFHRAALRHGRGVLEPADA